MLKVNQSFIRFANKKDCKQILSIYTPYISDTAISFETKVPSSEEFEVRFFDTTKKYPWLVYEEDGKVLGYAYGTIHRSRRAYNWSCEVSVYVDKNHHKKGIGTKLYQALFPILKEQGFYNLFAGITQPNEGSHKTHTKLGFKKIGTYKNIGYKFSKWHDVSWYQLELNSSDKPKEPISPTSLFTEKIQTLSVSPKDSEVQKHIQSLDDYLNSLYPADENFLDAPSALDQDHVQMFGAYAGELLVGIGAIKLLNDYGEIKRMWVPPIYRGFGISNKILSHLESVAQSKGLKFSRLETGDLQKNAIGLYKKYGYSETQPFGFYSKNNSSIFMEKSL